jgi:hypothetical protein
MKNSLVRLFGGSLSGHPRADLGLKDKIKGHRQHVEYRLAPRCACSCAKALR